MKKQIINISQLVKLPINLEKEGPFFLIVTSKNYWLIYKK